MAKEDHSTDTLYRTLRQQYMSGHLKEEERENLLFAPFGETAVSFRCLLYLLRHREGVEPSRLADKMHIVRQSATSVADHLEQEGYIFRQTHPSDRRKILLMITPKGEQAARKMLSYFRGYHERIAARFTEEELELYASLRSRMHQARDEVIREILDERQQG